MGCCASAENSEEEIRLFYVAVSRAKNNLFFITDLVSADGKGFAKPITL